MKRYTLAELQELPTLHSGQYDDLKVEEGTKRVWLSRMTVADGAPYNNQVTVETVDASGRRQTVDEYEAPQGLMKADQDLTPRQLIEEIQRIAEDENPSPEYGEEEWQAYQRREELLTLLHRKLTQDT